MSSDGSKSSAISDRVLGQFDLPARLARRASAAIICAADVFEVRDPLPKQRIAGRAQSCPPPRPSPVATPRPRSRPRSISATAAAFSSSSSSKPTCARAIAPAGPPRRCAERLEPRADLSPAPRRAPRAPARTPAPLLGRLCSICRAPVDRGADRHARQSADAANLIVGERERGGTVGAARCAVSRRRPAARRCAASAAARPRPVAVTCTRSPLPALSAMIADGASRAGALAHRGRS